MMACRGSILDASGSHERRAICGFGFMRRSMRVSMGFLFLHILFNVTFALATRFAQTRRYDYFFVAAVNYTVAAVLATGWMVLQGAWLIDGPTAVFGVIQGVVYAGAMVGVYVLLVRSGVGITFILMRLSFVVPTLISIFVFGERPGFISIMGLVLMLLSIPLLAGPRSVIGGARSHWYWPLIVGLIIFTGLGISASKAFNELSSPDRASTFVCVSFLASVPVALVIYRLRRRLQTDLPPLRGTLMTPGVMTVGVVMGAANVIQLIFLVAALQVVPGTIAFPVLTVVAMLLTIAAGSIFWGERHRPIAVWGVMAAIVGIVIINLE